MRMLHLRAWAKQGLEKEPYKVISKRKEVQPRLFQWSDKQQPVLQASETPELMSCHMYHGIFPVWESLSAGSVGAQAKHRSSQPPSALGRRKSRVSGIL